MTLWVAPPGSPGADTSGVVTAADAAALKAADIAFLLRALSCPGSAIRLAPPTAAEADGIRAAGLALGLYQTYQTSPCNAGQGATDGSAAVAQARALGAPPGMTLWADLEGTYATSTQVSLTAYLNSWAAAVSAAGFLPGLYCGPQPKLSGQDLGALPGFHAYWMAGALVPTPTPRGYQMLQLSPSNIRIGGMVYDLDVTQQDFRGGQPVFWAPS